jgi:hypothetical protein
MAALCAGSVPIPCGLKIRCTVASAATAKLRKIVCSAPKVFSGLADASPEEDVTWLTVYLQVNLKMVERFEL